MTRHPRRAGRRPGAAAGAAGGRTCVSEPGGRTLGSAGQGRSGGAASRSRPTKGRGAEGALGSACVRQKHPLALRGGTRVSRHVRGSALSFARAREATGNTPRVWVRLHVRRRRCTGRGGHGIAPTRFALPAAGCGRGDGRQQGGTVVPDGRPPASWYLSPSQRERAHPRASQPEVRDAAARPPPGRAAPSPPQGPCPPSSSPVPSSPTVPCGSPAHLDLSGAPNAVAAGGHVWSTFGKPTGRSLSTARARGGGAATRVWAPVRPTPGRVTRHCHCSSRSADSDPPEGAQEAPAGRGEAAPRGPRRGGPHARRRRARRGGGRAVARARERSRREAQGAGGQLRRRPAR